MARETIPGESSRVATSLGGELKEAGAPRPSFLSADRPDFASRTSGHRHSGPGCIALALVSSKAAREEEGAWTA